MRACDLTARGSLTKTPAAQAHMKPRSQIGMKLALYCPLPKHHSNCHISAAGGSHKSGGVTRMTLKWPWVPPAGSEASANAHNSMVADWTGRTPCHFNHSCLQPFRSCLQIPWTKHGLHSQISFPVIRLLWPSQELPVFELTAGKPTVWWASKFIPHFKTLSGGCRQK